MRVITSAADVARLLDAERSAGRTVGLVPTMGALHHGHRSLVERAVDECDVVTVSIFVNPLQFGDPSDLERYPRSLDADTAIAAAAGASVVFAPSVSDMYPGFPAPVATSVHVAGLGERWEGASRPGHFAGVATVVAKLFSLAGRCRAYFGEKDFQQLAVVRRMVVDLSMPVEVVPCPTVREPDGLAASSRNVRLSATGRIAARCLHEALAAGCRLVSSGVRDSAAVGHAMADMVAAEPAAVLDYAVAVDADGLQVPDELLGDVRLLVAATVDGVRLIDNTGCSVPPNRPPGPRRAPRPSEQATMERGALI